MNYLDSETNEKYIPYVVEPSVCVERLVLTVLCNAYHEDTLEDGTTKNGIKVYREVHEPDENGLYAPTGFPYLLLEDKDGNLSKQCGVESLSTLDEIISQQ